MHTLLQDIRYAFRHISGSVGFALIAVLTIGIGIGTNTAMFSLMDAVVLRPLSIPGLEQVIQINEQRGDNNPVQVSLADFGDWQRQNHTFSELAVQDETSLSLTGAGDPERVNANRSSSNLFTLLQVQPWLGRIFQSGEDQAGHDAEVVLSYSFWQRHFGGRTNMLGSSLTLDGRAYSIIGVMPQEFHYSSANDVFLPLAMTPEMRSDRKDHLYSALGRLKRGVTLDQARAEFRAIDARLTKAYPATNLGWSARLAPLIETVNGEYTPLYMRLMMGVGFILLLIVCANISNLQFSRSLSRRPEIAIRTAIGASRPRILRQLLTESILLGLCGGVVGIVLARINIYVNLMAMPQRIARYMPGWSNISLDWRALGYSVALALIVGIISGIAPAYAAMRVGVSEQLKAGSRTLSDTAKSHRLRNLFAIAQIALSVALVVGASLMATGTYAMLQATQRYDPDHLLTFSISLPERRYVTAAQQTAFQDQSLDRIRSIPGVLSADLTTALPYNNTGVWVQDFVIEHNPTLPGQFRNTQRITITPEYLASMRIPLVSGRLLSASDAAGTAPVATVSQSFARRYFPNQNPIGQRIQLGKDASGTPWLTVVGVVGDALTIWVDRVPQPAVYLSYRQFPVNDPTFAVRTDGNPLSIASAVRHVISSVDGALPVDNLESYHAYLHESLIGLIYVVATLAANAGIALLLSALGIFGVMANTVTERTQEIGIRLALGAERTHIEAMVIRRGLILAGVGLALGLPLAFGLARGVSSLIYGTDAGNHVIFTLTTLTIVVVALLATWLPAHRAAAIEPMSALRSE